MDRAVSRLAILALVVGACASLPVTSSPSGRGMKITGDSPETVETESAGGERTDNGAMPAGQHAQPGVQGFVASAGELSGRVVDADGKPVANAPVQLVSKSGERTLKTDKQGRFRTEIVEPTMVAVYGGMQVQGGSSTTEKVGGDEAIVLREAERPTKLAKPLSDPLAIPDYTDALRDKNVWVRAWLLVDVDETGSVSRVKLLNPPGYDLDAIAIRDAFKLKFEPARNRVDKPMSSMVVWKFEWPTAGSLPPNKWSELPCRKSADDKWYAMNKPYRDCSRPNMAAVVRTPWIERPR
jgi:hypothetical protein